MNVVAATPLLIMSGASVLALVLGVLPLGPRSRWAPALVAAAGCLATFVMAVVLWGERQVAFDGNVRADRFSMLLVMIVLTATLGVLALAQREPSAVDRRAEWTGLLMLSATGMVLVATSGDLITLFLGIELLSVSLYVLCAVEVWRERSLEAGLKYLIIGGIGSAVFVYGLAFLYGVTGSTRLSDIGATLSGASLTGEPLLLVALVLITAGLAFKASAVPFHMWTPDVYEGAPSPVTAFMATGTKTAAFAGFMLMFTGAMTGVESDWRTLVAAVAAVTILVGNIAALLQTNVKRLLAYSAIAQAGYLLIGIAVGSIQGAEAVLYYLCAYTAMTLAAFAIVIIREREVENGDTLAALTGYGRVRPWAGVVMTIAVLSLAGFPPLSGFVGKFLLFGAAVEDGMTWLAIVGAVGSAISLAYYLRIAVVMWSPVPDSEPAGRKLLRMPLAGAGVAVASTVAVVGLAIFASPLIRMCRAAAESLLAP
ncbi:MAG: NADH-quinone oxidoreductase subunit N [Thermoleophilia bacterium]|nr:NADH-quinone oxidoreductase subunit N [Thermoleophilia bacterium]